MDPLAGLGQTAGLEEEGSRGLLEKWKHLRPKERIFMLLEGADGGRNFSEQVSAKAQEHGYLEDALGRVGESVDAERGPFCFQGRWSWTGAEWRAFISPGVQSAEERPRP